MDDWYEIGDLLTWCAIFFGVWFALFAGFGLWGAVLGWLPAWILASLLAPFWPALVFFGALAVFVAFVFF